jgi:uncharacterized protein
VEPQRERKRPLRSAHHQVIAMCCLGECCEHGQGVAKDAAKAVECYEKAAERGDSTAMNNLGFCYQYGVGVAKDDTKAFELWGKAAEQGHLHAIYNLGLCYEYGDGVAEDMSMAFVWYGKAAAHGNLNAQLALERLNAPQCNCFACHLRQLLQFGI